MLYAVISDVHGNYPALRAVLDDAKRAGAEQFLLAGDYITDLPYTREIYETLRDLPNAVLVSGNREWYMGNLDPTQRNREQMAGLFFAEDALKEDGLAWAQSLPRSVTLKTPDGRKAILIEHICEEVNGKLHSGHGNRRLASGTLNEDFSKRPATHQEVAAFARGFLEMNPALDDLKKRAGADVVICGHNHMQYAVKVNGVLYINPGSCGAPCDHQTDAPYTLLRYEDGVFTVDERRVKYDVVGTVEEYRQSPVYQAAAPWCEMVIHAMETGRDYNRYLFPFLKEEEEKSPPKTDGEYNAAFRRAFQRVKEMWG